MGQDNKAPLDHYYVGGVGTEYEWRQCRYCHGYVAGPIGHRATQHHGGCPVAELEALRVAGAARPQPLDDEAWQRAENDLALCQAKLQAAEAKLAAGDARRPQLSLHNPGYVSDEGDETEDDFPRVAPLKAGADAAGSTATPSPCAEAAPPDGAGQEPPA